MQVKGRIWIELAEQSMIGGGKAELLDKTAKLGSLRKAATEMQMSYRQAWYSINQMNTSAPEPLIILKRGGKEGGIAEITNYGKSILKRYKELQSTFQKFLSEQNNI
ncbi:MAG: LysR family transcriptional regulator [Bacteroidales bacterium]|nr:LysR family transcriptional regulator [Bacteroidales bacterium]